MDLLKIQIKRNLQKLVSLLKTSNKFKGKTQRKFLYKGKPHEITLMLQNPYKNSQWAKYAQEGKTVVQIIETLKAGNKTFRYLGVVVDEQVHWYDSKTPFKLRKSEKGYIKAEHDGF
jgi:hypothetical protein